MAAPIAWTVLVALAILGLQGPARAQVPASEAATFHGLTFPANVAGAERISVRDYEKDDPGLGYSAGYRQSGAVTTVYIYDLKKSGIPDDPSAPMIKAEFESAKADMLRALRQAGYRNVEPKDLFSFFDAGNRMRLACASAGMMRSEEPRALVSSVCVGGWRGKFIKFRSTGEQQSQPDVSRFMRAWIDLLWPS
jgi:hypothetical protein